MIKETFLMLAVLSVGTVALGQTVYGQVSVSNTLTIDNDQCKVGVPNGLDFGIVDSDIISDETVIPLVLTNIGNVNATVEFYATNWFDISNPTTVIIDGENTRFSNTGSGISFSSKLPSNSTDDYVEMGDISVSNSNSTYWQVATTLVTGQDNFQGAIQQDMTFVSICQ